MRVLAGAGRCVCATLLLGAIAPILGLIAPTLATAALISVGGIGVSELADALKQLPVQQRGHPRPGLTAKQVRNLDALIHERDPGRIWIAVVSPLSVQATGDLTRALSDAINADGLVCPRCGQQLPRHDDLGIRRVRPPAARERGQPSR